MPLRSTRDGDVIELVLDRPEAYNAIDPPTRDALIEGLRSAEQTGARAVVLKGGGRGFCSGVDLLGSNAEARGLDVITLMRHSTQPLVRAVVDCPVPIVTQVHGACAGLGLLLAFGADFCIAAADSRFIAAFVQRAVLPDGGSMYLLPRVIGMARAKRFLMLGGTMGAAEAEQLGLITDVVPADDLEKTTAQLVATLLSLPTRTLSLAKGVLNRSLDLDLGSYLHEERTAQALVSTTGDAHEGIAAFREKRAPKYRGR
jgi:2-(1,2-epoxy-1,2-dihydrophenyl)acetyl-CoA isomerase